MRLLALDRREAGFTLIEILTVVVIIAILAAILIATFLRARAQATVTASKGNMKNIAMALETYFTDENAYPDILDALVPRYARAIPVEPCTGDPYGDGPPASYTPLSGNTDYELRVAFELTTCRIISPGFSYTPGGGLSESP